MGAILFRAVRFQAERCLSIKKQHNLYWAQKYFLCVHFSYPTISNIYVLYLIVSQDPVFDETVILLKLRVYQLGRKTGIGNN